MQRILRHLAPLALLIAALALVACGGGDEAESGGTAVEGDDPQAILEQTFAGEGDKKVDSGVFDLSMTINAAGGGSTLEGPVDISLTGPFQSQGTGKVPLFDIDLSFEGAGQNIQAGATSTGDKGFVNFMDQEYVVSDEVFQQFTTGFEQASAEQETPMSFAELGISPQDWLTDPVVDDGSSVGETDTVKVSGGVDVPKMLADVNVLLSQAGSLGIPDTGQLPTKLTEEQIAMVEEAVKEASVEIDTGKDDSILRRIAFTLAAEDPEGSGGTADIAFDLSLTELNEDQEIAEPEDAKPFEELLGQLGGLGGLGGLGLGVAPAEPGGSGVPSTPAAPDAAAAKAYAQCIADAGQDTAAVQECAALIG